MSREETRILERARDRGAFVAWRDRAGALQVHDLVSRERATIGRATGNTIVLDHLLISRDHAEVVMIVRDIPESTTVYLHDLRSKHGTEHRRVPPDGQARPDDLQRAGTPPAQTAGLAHGDHDVLLAGEVWIRVGGVPPDCGATSSRADELPRPTPRERDVLVELCRPRFRAPERLVATPSNAEIGKNLQPTIGAERVSDIVSTMYAKYGLHGTNVQNRLELVELALRQRFVGPADYM